MKKLYKIKSQLAQKIVNKYKKNIYKKENPINESGNRFEKFVFNIIQENAQNLNIRFTDSVKILSTNPEVSNKTINPDFVVYNSKNKSIYIDAKNQNGKGNAHGIVSETAEYYQLYGKQVLFVVGGNYYTEEVISSWNAKRKALGIDFYSHMIHVNDLIPFLEQWRYSNMKKFSNIMKK